MSADAGLLGSIDANRGDPQNGWDTDQFPTDLYDTVHAMMVVLEAGGLGTGGLNFDAKVRRESTDIEDMFIAHIGGMDSFARGLIIADRVLADPRSSLLRFGRYTSFDSGDGQRFENGELDLAALRDLAAAAGEPEQRSAKQELMENLVNDYIVRGACSAASPGAAAPALPAVHTNRLSGRYTDDEASIADPAVYRSQSIVDVAPIKLSFDLQAGANTDDQALYRTMWLRRRQTRLRRRTDQCGLLLLHGLSERHGFGQVVRFVGAHGQAGIHRR